MTEAEEARARLRGILPMLAVMINQLRMQEPKGKLQFAVVAKSPDGSGRVGPSWEFENFLKDLAMAVEFDEGMSLYADGIRLGLTKSELLREGSSTETREYLSDDWDMEKNRLAIFAGENGDWYVSVIPEGDRFGPAVRVTTSGARNEYRDMATHIARAYWSLPRITKKP